MGLDAIASVTRRIEAIVERFSTPRHGAGFRAALVAAEDALPSQEPIDAVPSEGTLVASAIDASLPLPVSEGTLAAPATAVSAPLIVTLGGMLGNGSAAVSFDHVTRQGQTPLPAGRFDTPHGIGVFGAPRDEGTRSHAGIDLGAPVGTTIRPYQPGTVHRIWGETSDGGFENTKGGYGVVVRHDDGTFSTYLHMRFDPHRLGLQVGAAVSRGTRIGAVGSTGDSDGPHLHFGLFAGDPHAGGTPIDPTNLLFP